MGRLEVKNFDNPDEVRPFVGKGQADVVMLAGKPVARRTFEPGWRWSANVKPIDGTPSCELSHLGYLAQGRLLVRMDDGTEQLAGSGEAVAIPPGHDAEVVGEESVVFLDFGEFSEYANRG